MTVDELNRAWQDRRADPEGALQAARQVAATAASDGDDLLLGRALTVEGACLVACNEYEAGLRALLAALPRLQDAAPPALAMALAEVGHVECVLGDPSSGLDHLLEALALSEQIGDRAGAAATLNRIGIAFLALGELDDARRSFERCLALHEHLDDGVAEAGARNNLAKVATRQGDHGAALDHLAAARRGFEAAAEPRGVAMTDHNTALVHVATGDAAAARPLLEHAIDGYLAAGHPHGAVEARTDFARLLDPDEPERALAMFELAHTEAERLALPRECAAAAEALADLHRQRDEPTTALAWLLHLRQVERQLFDQTSDRRLRALQVRHQLEQLQRDSVTDMLTGLLNRRGLERVLEQAALRRRSADEPVSVVLLDIDDFKLVNDRLSHAVGDEVLRRLGTVLRETVRPEDVCARLGGEEFVVVLAGCELAGAHRVADDLRGAIAGSDHWAALDPALQVTVSVGVAALGTGPGVSEMLAPADRALYAAKDAGKNQVVS